LPSAEDARTYFFSDARRTVQTILGLLWLLDGALQLQPFMYGPGFVHMLEGMAPAQPHWLATTLLWGSSTMAHDQILYNTLAALLQLGIGLGILYRPTVKQALIVSFVWSLGVWWFGEAFGMLFMSLANALTGAPGAAFLYFLIGLLVWPNERPGGLLGVTGARVVWANLWLLMGVLWLLAVNSSANATYSMIKAAPAGAAWLATLQKPLKDAAQGHGLVIALALAALSVAIGLAVALNRRPRTFLGIAIVLSLVYWVVGQGLGGILTGTATDPNAGPLFVLLSTAMYSLVPFPSTEGARREVQAPAPGSTAPAIG
jgi:hypothetical protein